MKSYEPYKPVMKQMIVVITVNYDMSAEDAISAIRISRTKRPGLYASSRLNFATVREGEHQLEAILVCFDQSMIIADALVELDKLGLRAGELRELLALGAQHPDLQRKFRILAAGELFKDSNGYQWVPSLTFTQDWFFPEREMHITASDRGACSHWRFLAFAK